LLGTPIPFGVPAFILSWSRDGTLRLWKFWSDEARLVFEGHTGCFLGAIVLPNERILSSSNDGVRVWPLPAAATGGAVRSHCIVAWHGLVGTRVEFAEASGRVVISSERPDAADPDHFDGRIHQV
jgi:WD40 repeat protein